MYITFSQFVNIQNLSYIRLLGTIIIIFINIFILTIFRKQIIKFLNSLGCNILNFYILSFLIYYVPLIDFEKFFFLRLSFLETICLCQRILNYHIFWTNTCALFQSLQISIKFIKLTNINNLLLFPIFYINDRILFYSITRNIKKAIFMILKLILFRVYIYTKIYILRY